ncbi:hypothetical protein GCM10025865_07880 [Paraoerskovia sediminicola]|uniref:Molybdopterin dinucleotide-binding domain-containing protein n=1 Tax=Paraoerskovia sediminicola TaxID=1138587 RepID=A0ABN6X9L0_9CELL|nr:hypothetical protein GCM10025865_07880 [Paraoerskovia sediminicola]
MIHAAARWTDKIRADTVFMPFHWSGEGSVNRITTDATDPISGMPEFKVCAVSVTAAPPAPPAPAAPAGSTTGSTVPGRAETPPDHRQPGASSGPRLDQEVTA